MNYYDIRVLFMIFIFYSFLGWCYEIIRSYITYKRIINRGFFIGPWVPIYGVGAILMTLFLKTFMDNIVLLFMLCILLFSLIEYVTSFVMEKLFKARWWDYSHRKCNFNGRICLEATIFFGFAGLLAMYVVNPFLIKLFESMNPNILTIISIVISIIFIVDVVLSIIIISSLKGVIGEVKKDNTEEITELVKEILLGKNYTRRRLVHAFPRINIR